MDAPPTTTQKSSKGGATRRKGQKSLKNQVETGSSKSNSKDKSRPGIKIVYTLVNPLLPGDIHV